MTLKTDDDLTLQQEQFCRNYVSSEYFGNGTRAYMAAYPDAQYDTARNEASVTLAKPCILKRIHDLLDKAGWNDDTVDSALLYVILQMDELPSKVAAIREYNKLKKRTDDAPKGTTILIADEKKIKDFYELKERLG